MNLSYAIKVATVARSTKSLILQYYDSDDNVEFDEKKDGSPLTKADIASHDYLAQHLPAIYDIPVVSEESESTDLLMSGPETFWLIDPLDGTKEFVSKNDDFTVNIALIHQGVSVMGAVYAPCQDKVWFGNILLGAYTYQDGNMSPISCIRAPFSGKVSVALSRYHDSPATDLFLNKLTEQKLEIEKKTVGSSLKFCYLAEGKIDLYPRFGLTSQWDTAAGQAVLQASGGHVMSLKTLQTLRYGQANVLNDYFLAISGPYHHEFAEICQTCLASTK